jgi:predicted NACHT family NTPase
MFTNLLAGGWDFAKQINRGSRFGPEPKLAVLANLADRLHEARLREFTAEHFKAAVKEVLPFYASRAPELLVELCRDGLVVPEGQYFGFLHHSFQEYLAATYLTELGGEKARRAVRRFLSGNEWWGEVVKFSIALSKNPQSTRRYIDKAAFRLTTHIQGKIAQSRQKELLEALALAYPGSTV